MKDQPRYEPGVYKGKRFVWPGAHHEYITVIPENEKRLKKNVRKHVTEIGPNGERGYIVSASVKRNKRNLVPGKKFMKGTMTGGTNMSERDLKAFKAGKKARGIKKLNVKGEDIEKVGSKIHEQGQVHGGAKYYPGVFDNWFGKDKNSNTYTRSVLRDAGVRTRKEKTAPGSNFRYKKGERAIQREQQKELAKLRGLESVLDDAIEFAQPHNIYTNPYDDANKPKDGWNKQEQVASELIKATPYLKGAVNGAIIGGTIAPIPGVGMGIGAAAGALAQKGLHTAGAKEVGDRKPMSGMVAAGTLPVASLVVIKNKQRIADWMKRGGPKIEKAVRNMPTPSPQATRGARKVVHGLLEAGDKTIDLESVLNDAIELAVRGPRETASRAFHGKQNQHLRDWIANQRKLEGGRARGTVKDRLTAEQIEAMEESRKWQDSIKRRNILRARRMDSEAIRRS